MRRRFLQSFALVITVQMFMFSSGCRKPEPPSKVETAQVLQPIATETGFTKLDNKRKRKAQKIFDRYVEELRWSRYWDGVQSKKQAYVEGEKIPVAFFRVIINQVPRIGFCVPALSICGVNRLGSDRRLINLRSSGSDLSPLQAVQAFSKGSFGESVAGLEQKKPTNFEVEEAMITLPKPGIPSAIKNKTIPGEASRDVRNYLKFYKDWKYPRGCTCTHIFSLYEKPSNDWYVLRNCSKACQLGFRGESIQVLSRWNTWNRGWIARIGGFTRMPQDVAWLKPRILKAEMSRLTVP